MERLSVEEIKYLKQKMQSNMNVYFYDEVMKVFDELISYRDAEEQGLLLRLPCKVGDTVYEASKFWNTVLDRHVSCVGVYRDNRIFIRNGCGDSFEFGKEVFLTREEAEQALKQMGE